MIFSSLGTSGLEGYLRLPKKESVLINTDTAMI